MSTPVNSKPVLKKPEINHKEAKKRYELAKETEKFGIDRNSLLFQFLFTIKEETGLFNNKKNDEVMTEFYDLNKVDCKGPFPGPVGLSPDKKD